MITRESLRQTFKFCLEKDFIDDASQATKVAPDRIRLGIETYLNESFSAYELIKNHITTDKAILEVGPGIPFLAIYLANAGYNVEITDPYEEPFSALEVITGLIFKHSDLPKIKNHSTDICFPILTERKYGLIYSLNVIEHLKSFNEACINMLDLLDDNGMMVHSCPNYAVPYEPHFGVFLSPILREKIHRKEINSNPELWKSINFITFHEVKKAFKAGKAEVTFEKNTMFKQISRLRHDEIFSKRHRRIHAFFMLFHALHLAEIFRFVPPSLGTPMTFYASRPSTGDRAT